MWNRTEQRRGRWRGAIVAGLLTGLTAGAQAEGLAEIPALERVRVIDKPAAIADFVLTDQEGEPFRFSELEGRVAFVFFGFTQCRNICPVAMQQMRLFERDERSPVGQVALVMISVDGERDSPTAMKDFLTSYSPGFLGLTGTPAQVKPIARSFTSSFFKGDVREGHYDVSHSPQVFVVDPAGRLRAELYNAPVESMQAVATILLNEAAPL